jgi:hypothetical protein
MSLEALFVWIAEHRVQVLTAFLLAPWLTWCLCQAIPGCREESFLLSVNLWLAVISLLMTVGYLSYASNTGGWSLVVEQADVLLLLAPPYYAIASLWMSRQRMPLREIPAFKTLQGLVVVGAVYFAIAALFSRIRIYFFSYLPFASFLWLLAVLLSLGYWGYLRFVESFSSPSTRNNRRQPPKSNAVNSPGQTISEARPSVDQELEQLRRELKSQKRKRPRQ